MMKRHSRPRSSAWPASWQYGYRRSFRTALIRTEGWHVNAKRVSAFWRREGLKVPLATETGQAVAQRRILHRRLRPCWPNPSGPMTSSWIEHTMGGSSALAGLLTVIDEFTRCWCMVPVVVPRQIPRTRTIYAMSTDALRPTWPAGSYPFRQRAQSLPLMPSATGSAGSASRPSISSPGHLGRTDTTTELQLKAPGRNPEHGDLLYTEGGQSADRTMAASLQYHPAA